MKKFFAILLSAMLMLSMAVPAMAEDTTTYSITINNSVAGYTYAAYQIFKGDLDKAADNDDETGTNAVLSNIQWGDGVNGTAILTALKSNSNFNVGESSVNAFADCENAADVAKVLAANNSFAAAFADVVGANLTETTVGTWNFENEKYTVSGLEAGYYLVKNTIVPTAGAYTEYIVEVVEDSTVQPKASVPSVGKTVDDNDANIGDTVTFTLTATMPSTFEGYESYKVIFRDTLSAGLTFGKIETVTVNDNSVTTGYELKPEQPVAGQEFTITFADVIDLEAEAGRNIVVTYTATLNENAVIAGEGNPNVVYLEYSNNPNGEGTGKTPEAEVKVYTWDMGVLKYADGDETMVQEGVKFILLNADKDKIANVANGKIVRWDTYKGGMGVTEYELDTDAQGKISIGGLESGTYYLRETQALPGYNKLTDDVTVTVDGKTDGTYQTFIAKVENNAGSVLPETGGMGTTLFYIVGGLMAVGAVVLLVTKKRMGSEA